VTDAIDRGKDAHRPSSSLRRPVKQADDGLNRGGAGRTEWLNRAIGGVSRKSLMLFSRQLSTLLNSGVPIVRSLRVLERQQRPGAFRDVVSKVAERVARGSSLAEALAEHPRAFDRTYVQMVAAGEASGSLEIILKRLAEHIENNVRIRRKVITASIYPASVLLIAILVLIFMLVVVVPRFVSLYDEFDAELPAATRTVMGLSHWMLHGVPPGLVVLALIPICLFVLIVLMRRSQPGAYLLDLFRLKLPVFGGIARKGAMARTARTLATLVSSGVPILEALRITRDAAGNRVFASALDDVHEEVRHGSGLAEPMLRTRVIDSFVVDMVQIGEETGELDQMLNKVADNYEEDVEMLTAALLSLFKPVMIIIVALIVGSIILAMALPYAGIIEQMGR